MKQVLSEVLLNALIDGGIEKIMLIGNEYFKRPIMLVDVEYNLISHYPDHKINDPLWDAIHEFGTTPPGIINKFHIENMMPLGVNRTEPYYIDWGFLKDHPRILVNIFANNKCYGYLSVLCDEYETEMADDIKLIGSVLAIAFQKQHTEIQASEDYQTMFLNSLFDGKVVTKEQLKSWIQYLPGLINEPFYICCSSFDSQKDSKITLNFIQATIKSIYPGTLFITKNNQLIFLFKSIKSEQDVFMYIKGIQDALSDYKLRFGVSNQFFELNKASLYLKQAKYALSIAGTKEMLYMQYKDCMLNQMATVIYATLPRESYVHEAIDRLDEYDKNNNTEYLLTLKVYLKYLFCTKKTIEILHIHRNTLPHRLEVIERIGQVDLKNIDTCMVLLFSLYLES